MTPYQRNVVSLSLGAEGPRRTRYSLTLQKKSFNNNAMEIPNARRLGPSKIMPWKTQIWYFNGLIEF
jgi:hypothetical protein